MSNRFPRDPYQTSAKFNGFCCGKSSGALGVCNAPIARGAPIFYYPNEKRAFLIGGACQCGDRARADFEAARADESNY